MLTLLGFLEALYFQKQRDREKRTVFGWWQYEILVTLTVFLFYNSFPLQQILN